MTFPQKIMSLLTARRWGPSDLADAIGVECSTVSNWLHDRNLPKLSLALKVARALDVPLDYLADDEMDVPPPAPEVSPEEWALLTLYRSLGIGVVEAMRRLAPPAPKAVHDLHGRPATNDGLDFRRKGM